MAFWKWNGWLRDLDLGRELWASVALMWEPLSCKRDIPNFLGSGRHLSRGRQSLTPESLLYQQHYHNQHLQGGGFRVMSFLDYQIVTHHERIFWFQHQPWFYDFQPCFECAESWWWATWDAVCDERWKTQRKRSMEFAASGCAFNHTGSGARRVWKTGKKISRNLINLGSRSPSMRSHGYDPTKWAQKACSSNARFIILQEIEEWTLRIL